VRPIEGQFLSIPWTPLVRNTYRRPARLTFAVAGTAAAAAALAAVGLATATPGGPPATSAPGAAPTAHGGIGILPLAQINPGRRASSAAEGGSPAPHLAAGAAPATATGRAILASGLAATLTVPARSGGSTPARPGNQPPSHQAHAAVPVPQASTARLASNRHAGSCGTSSLHWWICAAEHALERHGVPRRLLSTNAAYIVVEHESGANPYASNGWDSNAAAGHPSEGIAQVIGPTFHANALPGHHNIWNPVDNMIAAFRYAIGRYGSMNNIPGVVNVRHGGSYVGY
jgi:hypothetical protein